MTRDEFVASLDEYLDELAQEVADHFRLGNRERGREAFRRWRDRLTGFLTRHAPDEAKYLRQKIWARSQFAVAIHDESPFDTFVREDGDFFESYLLELRSTAAKGRVDLQTVSEPVRESEPPLSENSLVNGDSGTRSVFISYSHDDKEWLAQLRKMLQPLIQNQKLDIWDDTRIQAGEDWRHEIEQALDAAGVGLLLVSPHFLASDFIVNNELPTLLKAAREKGVTILWISVSACLFEESELRTFQAANDPKHPLDSLSSSEINTALVEICKKIKTAALK